MRFSLAFFLVSKSVQGFAIPPFANTARGATVLSSAIEGDAAPADALLEDDEEMALEDVLSFLEEEGGLEGFGILEEESESPLSEDVVSQFLVVLEQTPSGMMDDEELSLLRGVMVDLSATPEKAPDVQLILFRMLDEYERAASDRNHHRMKLLQPTSKDFELAAQSWFESGHDEAGPKILSLFFEQDQFFGDTGICAPTLVIVEMAMQALAESRTRDADRKASEIVDRLEDYHLSPTVNMYTSLIACYARNRQNGSASRAEKMLDQALEIFPPGIASDGSATGMTVDAFNVVLTAWAKCGMDYGPERAEKLLVRMEEADQQQGILKPTAQSFTSLIDAHAQLNTWESACQAERTLNALLDYYLEEKEASLEPNIATWGIVLSCWNRVSKKGSVDAASKAAHLLKRMDTLYESGRLSYPPDAIAFVTVMNSWCSCKDISKGGAKHAEEILDEMNERYLDGDDSFKPSAKSVRAVVDAWIKSDRQEALFKAEEVFEKYDELDYLSAPEDQDVVKDIYKSLIFGWTQKEDPERAHEYLADMIEMGLQTDSFCYDRVIEAYNNVEEENTLAKVKEVFELLEQQSAAGNVKPNERVYTTFIRALTKARVPHLATAAKTVLDRMYSFYEEGNKGIKPTVFTYNAVLKACADTLSDDAAANLESFKVALSIFNELRSKTDEEPDHVTFGNMIKCSNLLPQGPQREAMITTTFQLCCRRGFVNAYVIRDLQEAGTDELWRDLCNCPEGDVNMERLPQGWIKMFESKNNSNSKQGSFDRRKPKNDSGRRGQKRF